MKTARQTSVLISVILLFACLAADYSFASEVLNDMYKSKGLSWPMLLEWDDSGDLMEAPYVVDDGEFPVEALFVLPDRRQEPVVESVRFSGSQEPYMVEVWISSHGDGSQLRQIYKGRPGNEVDVYPVVARNIRIRFFLDTESPATLPEVEVLGRRDVGEFAAAPGTEDIYTPYVTFYQDVPVGYSKMWRDKGTDGYIYNEESFLMAEIKLPDSDELTPFDQESLCEYFVLPGMEIEDYECEFPGKAVSGKGHMDDHRTLHMKREVDYDDLESAIGRRFKNTAEESAVRKAAEKELKLKNEFVVGEETNWPIPLDAVYDKLVAEGMVVGLEREYNVVMPLMADVYEVKAEVIDFFPSRTQRADLYAVWIHSSDYKDVNNVALVESNGSVLRYYEYTTHFESWRVYNIDEWQLEPFILDPELMIEKLRDKIREMVYQPDAVDHAVTTIRWSEVPPEMLAMESSRQKILSVEEIEPGLFEAKVETARVFPEDAPLVESETLTPEEINTYLLSDDSVETGNENLIRLADEIAGGERDPVQASILIFNWLIHNISPYTEETFYVPSASEILEDGTGDCKHFAVMFATLARIRGIPTRYAIGQRYLGGSYGYHVWNQIYVNGRWIDIDASDLGLFPGAMHIQMQVSSAFNEQGHLGVLLGTRPSPDLETIEHGPIYSDFIFSDVFTEIGTDYYQDAFFNCRINVPGDFSFKVMDLGMIRKMEISVPGKEDLIAGIYMVPSSKDESRKRRPRGKSGNFFDFLSTKEKIHLLDLFGAMEQAKMTKAGTTRIADREAKFVTARFVDRHNRFVHIDMTMLEVDDRGFIFLFIAPSDVFFDYEKIIKELKLSLKVF